MGLALSKALRRGASPTVLALALATVASGWLLLLRRRLSHSAVPGPHFPAISPATNSTGMAQNRIPSPESNTRAALAAGEGCGSALPLLLLRADHARTAALEECLVLAASALPFADRKTRKALMLRTGALLDQLAEDEDDAAASSASSAN